MSQKFVMLLLASKPKIVTLGAAAKVLTEGSQDTADHSKLKSECRPKSTQHGKGGSPCV